MYKDDVLDEIESMLEASPEVRDEDITETLDNLNDQLNEHMHYRFEDIEEPVDYSLSMAGVPREDKLAIMEELERIEDGGGVGTPAIERAYEVTFTNLDEPILVEPPLTIDVSEDDRENLSESEIAAETAEEILFDAPAFDHITYTQQEEMEVESVTAQETED